MRKKFRNYLYIGRKGVKKNHEEEFMDIGVEPQKVLLQKPKREFQEEGVFLFSIAATTYYYKLSGFNNTKLLSSVL